MYILGLILLLSTTFCVRSKLRNVAQADGALVGANDDSTDISCPHHCLQQHSSNHSTKKQNGCRIFYLIVVHNNRTLHDAVHLLRAIRDPRNIVVIHVDQKANDLIKNNDSILHKEVKECSCGSIMRLESVYNVKWSEWSMNLPTLWGLQLAVTEYKDQWDVFINLSGDTVPVYSTEITATMLSDLPYNFVTSSSCETGLLPTNVYTFPSYWHKRAHYTHSDTLADPIIEHIHRVDKSWRNTTIQTYFGSQWMILQRDFCSWVVQQLGDPQSLASQYREYLVSSGFLMTDETFFPSLLMQVDEFSQSLPQLGVEGHLLWRNGSSSQIKAVRYERMDEHVPSAFGRVPLNQRYEVPNDTNVDQPRPWGPYFLGVYDLAGVRDSGALFLRKVSSLVDHNMVNLFPVKHSSLIPNISWPFHVELSGKPNWERIKAKMMLAQRQAAAHDLSEQDEIAEDIDEEEL
ncbi:hypothetical protein MPSEU_000675900 [Mayamaea pseudoterrestris]|nr:hypothetical protein MPSEU_000675900 [Mayamaea pseudoterrestris]